MADPLPLDDFFGPLVKEVGARFYLPGVRQHSRTAGGEVLTAVMGTSLWRGDVTAVARSRRDVEALQAQFEVLDYAGGSFLVHPRICGPAHDPDGSLIAGHTPTIHNLNANNRRLSTTGLPQGYSLQAGDFMSFEYGENPTRYALHRVVGPTRTANSEGIISQIDVLPHIRPGALVGAAVTLYRPVCKAVILPDSIQWPGNGPMPRIQFSFIQTLA